MRISLYFWPHRAMIISRSKSTVFTIVENSPMKILIAPDKFKDALSAKAVCKAIDEGLRLTSSSFGTYLFPMADGGEGTAEILTYHNKGQPIKLTVHDPLFRKIEVQYGLSADKNTAYIEMAEASGLKLLKPEERNCLLTTSYGTGEMIRDAASKGVAKIILGIGGSATNDAGIGMAAALGFKFYDSDKNELKPIGKNLQKIATIKDTTEDLLKDIEFTIACDVENPLYGRSGAAHVYAPQKGADKEAVKLLDKGLLHFATWVKKQYEIDLQAIKGAGAAGGFGAGAVLFLNAKLVSGVELVMQECNFESHLKEVDLVITGEGKIDQQSLSGKLIGGITDKAKNYKIPVIALCGILELNEKEVAHLGLHSAFSIIKKPCTLEEALENTYANLKHAAFNIGRLIIS